MFSCSYLVVGVDGDKETGQQLRIDKEITEEPALVYGGYRHHHRLQVVSIALVAPEGPKHSTEIPGNRIILLANKTFLLGKMSKKLF